MAKCKSVEFTIPSADGTPIKINYCFRGRCEKKLVQSLPDKLAGRAVFGIIIVWFVIIDE